jgi:FMN phosphatase YigB (HAD superfamily)
MTKGIIFDVDGTLIHTSLDYVNGIIKQVIEELGYGEYSPEKVHRFWWGDRKVSRRELIEIEFKARFEEFIVLFRRLASDFDYAKQFKKLYDDVKPVLDELVKKAHIKFDNYLDPLQLSAQFVKADILKDYPKMIAQIPEKEWQNYFINEAKKLSVDKLE